MSPTPAPPSSANDAPPPSVLLATYLALGSALSFLVGHDPSRQVSTNHPFFQEICPSIAVICLFLCSYSVYDVLTAGIAHAKDGYKLDAKKEGNSEQAHLAERAQMNQVEQLPCFLMGTLFFSVLVNGTVGALLAAIWAILRRAYAHRYRNSVGVPMTKKGLTTYTIPCYFIVNTMLAGASVHALRCMMVQL